MNYNMKENLISYTKEEKKAVDFLLNDLNKANLLPFNNNADLYDNDSVLYVDYIEEILKNVFLSINKEGIEAFSGFRVYDFDTKKMRKVENTRDVAYKTLRTLVPDKTLRRTLESNENLVYYKEIVKLLLTPPFKLADAFKEAEDNKK